MPDTYRELMEQANALLAKADEAKTKEMALATKQILEKMEHFGLTLQDLRVAGAKAGNPPNRPGTIPSAPKYKGPNNELWVGGRGRKPDWALEVIKASGEAGLEKYRIKP